MAAPANSPEPLIAVDIGSFSLKFLVLEPGSEIQRRVKAMHHLVLPSFQHEFSEEERAKFDKEGFEKELISRLQKFLTKQLTELLYDNQIQTKRAATLASGRAVTIRYIEMPPVPEADQLQTAIQTEATKQMPFSMENAVLGNTILGNIKREDKDLMQIMVAALQKDIVGIMQQNLKGGGLVTDAILSLPQVLELALGDQIKTVTAGQDPPRVGVIHCGHRTTSIMVYKGGVLQFYRDINMAGETITDAIFNGGEVDGKPWKPANYAEATELKHKLGILPPDEIQALSGVEKFAASQIFAMVEKIFQHIQLSISFYISQFSESSLDKIILTGGSASMKNFREFIQESLENPVETPALLSNLNVSAVAADKLSALTTEEPALVVAAGLGRYSDQPNVINFIDILHPGRRKQSSDMGAVSSKFTEGLAKRFGISFQLDEDKIIILSILGIVLFLLGLLYFPISAKQQVAKAKEDGKVLNRKLEELKSTQTEVTDLIAQKEQLAKTSEFPKELASLKLLYSHILIKMAQSTPNEIYLSGFAIEKPADKLVFTLDGTCDSPDRVFDYLKRLGQTCVFKDINTKSVEGIGIDEEREFTRFSLQGTVLPPVEIVASSPADASGSGSEDGGGEPAEGGSADPAAHGS